jgi:acetamidase/formamidase
VSGKRSGGGEVDVDEISGGAIELHPDPVNLQGAVVEVGEVERSIGDGVVDKESYTSTRATYTILPNEGKARERFRIRF